MLLSDIIAIFDHEFPYAFAPFHGLAGRIRGYKRMVQASVFLI